LRLTIVLSLIALVVVACSQDESPPTSTPVSTVAPTATAVPATPVAAIIPTPTPEPTTYRVLLPDGRPHTTANVRSGDLLGDGSMQLLVTEPSSGRITWLQGLDNYVEFTDGLTEPVRTHVTDLDGDGDQDLLVADIGFLRPTNKKLGSVVLFENTGEQQFTPVVLLDDVRRVACAEAADLDGDGDLDIAVCVFGHLDGKTIWLEQTSRLEFVEHLLDDRPGAIHAFPIDADGDGDMDLAVALAQQFEEVILYRNDGGGHFEAEVLFKAPVEYYGLSGIEPVDLDEDGDIDILFTNGDTLDFPEERIDISPNNFYGLAWLENDGSGNFAHHQITRYWGAFAVKAADLDGDDDLDLVLSGMQIANIYPEAVVENVIWMENDGDQGFTRHTLDIALPPLMLTLEVVDVDGDGVPDIVGGSHDYTGREVGHRLVVFNIPIDK
jgi:hypothetical protein